ncbi:MAG: hypothetical protein RJA31_671 [Actinomycetota bacterium]
MRFGADLRAEGTFLFALNSFTFALANQNFPAGQFRLNLVRRLGRHRNGSQRLIDANRILLCRLKFAIASEGGGEVRQPQNPGNDQRQCGAQSASHVDYGKSVSSGNADAGGRVSSADGRSRRDAIDFGNVGQAVVGGPANKSGKESAQHLVDGDGETEMVAPITVDVDVTTAKALVSHAQLAHDSKRRIVFGSNADLDAMNSKIGERPINHQRHRERGDALARNRLVNPITDGTRRERPKR